MRVQKIGIVSLSSGIMGENFIQHELNLGLERLKQYGIDVEFLKNHPECRAQDLLTAFMDDSIDMILCAIGGEDTYRLLPYIFDNNEL